MKESDNEDFFRFILDQRGSAEDLISAFIEFHGDINWGKQHLFVDTLSKRLGRDGGIGRDTVLGSDGQVRETLFREVFGVVPYPYFASAQSERVKTAARVFSPNANQWQDKTLPTPMNMRLSSPERPAYDILSVDAPELFWSPYGYQCFSSDNGIYWPDASSRGFSRSVCRYPRIRIAQSVVITQDQFDSGNFAHFLYDSLPRIMLFCECLPEIARECVFLMGGMRQEIHNLFLPIVQARCSLESEQFRFTTQRVVADLDAPVYYFSDQRAAVTHPLYMAHPAVVHLVRDIAPASKRTIKTSQPIYISRADASLRRLSNDSDVIEALDQRGFLSITMSKLSLLDQFEILANTPLIVAPHGMGLTPFLFNRRLLSAVEIFNPSIGSDTYAFVAKALGAKYSAILGEPTDVSKADYRVDIGSLQKIIDSVTS